ncbi:MAG: transglutaminase-like cysteine peptidase [Gammaproteobacteria bacterium]|jgi:predicted transglutaminase-like cysteine proteinase|nr:transglutaminase-like cysteine peptidase [Gammaproteobacteria bacterium]MBU2295283.1 transglutaminase-like cysteine peptidase [Gammaproteobacteria bacterium]
MPPRQLTQGWFKRLNRALLGGCILLIGLASALANWDFGVILKNAESRYGNLGAAKQRIQAWEAQIKASTDSSERDKLTEVNRFFNRQIRFVDDIQLWKQNDYWATPVEMLVKGAGDCEDYSIGKYFTLRRLGIPSDKLRITYVKALNYNQAHMVLTYYASPGAEPLVLDNLINEIKPASQRKDLLPVYAFNAEGLYLAGSNSKKSDSKKLSRWQDILKKMRTEGFAIGEG